MKIGKCGKLFCIYNRNDKKSCVVHVKNLKQTLNHRRKPEKVHQMIKFKKKTVKVDKFTLRIQ